MTIFDRMLEAQEFLGKNREHAQSPEEKELFLLAIDALWFVWRNGQSYEFERYRSDECKSPPWVIASFNTRDDAEVWIRERPQSPDLALLLIADEYHVVLSSRDGERRALVPDLAIAIHIEEMTRNGLPPAVATFNTRDEAEAWWGAQAEHPAQAVIQIGSERYLAAFYANIQHRALFPFSAVERLHAIRRRGEQKEAGE
ncbi:hypothetical protein [Archangium violaceum]|uniref:hypothetical protein n=1 Tax=Archangium violaceum TaxID=83451 RepID=UPI0006980AA5|nr:hypothetical protein [Archangium violaceum]